MSGFGVGDLKSQTPDMVFIKPIAHENEIRYLTYNTKKRLNL